jgi:predicted RNase H-like HicB family nuclease
MKIKATIELLQKGKWCIAKVPELDFVAQGKTIEEAKANLEEVMRIQFAEMKEMGMLDDPRRLNSTSPSPSSGGISSAQE